MYCKHCSSVGKTIIILTQFYSLKDVFISIVHNSEYSAICISSIDSPRSFPPVSFPTYLSTVDVKFDNNNVSRFPTLQLSSLLWFHHLIRDA